MAYAPLHRDSATRTRKQAPRRSISRSFGGARIGADIGASASEVSVSSMPITASTTGAESGELAELTKWLAEKPERGVRLGLKDDDRARRVVELHRLGRIELSMDDMQYLIRQLLYGRVDEHDELAVIDLLDSLPRPEDRDNLLADAGKKEKHVRRRFDGPRRALFAETMDRPEVAKTKPEAKSEPAGDPAAVDIDASRLVVTPKGLTITEGMTGTRQSTLQLTRTGGMTTDGKGFILEGHVDLEGGVTFKGGTDADAREWRIGLIQNGLKATTAGVYRTDERGNACFLKRMDSTIPQCLDSTKDAPDPFYDKDAQIRPSATNGEVSFKVDDNPRTSWARQDVCDWETENGSKWKSGRFMRSCGEYQLMSWLVAEYVDGNGCLHRRFLKYAIWNVDFRTTSDLAVARPTADGGGVNVLASGEGNGGVEPVIDTGTLFNFKLNNVNWSCKRRHQCGECP